jgi:hypothetical protein
MRQYLTYVMLAAVRKNACMHFAYCVVAYYAAMPRARGCGLMRCCVMDLRIWTPPVRAAAVLCDRLHMSHALQQCAAACNVHAVRTINTTCAHVGAVSRACVNGLAIWATHA